MFFFLEQAIDVLVEVWRNVSEANIAIHPKLGPTLFASVEDAFAQLPPLQPGRFLLALLNQVSDVLAELGAEQRIIPDECVIDRRERGRKRNQLFGAEGFKRFDVLVGACLAQPVNCSTFLSATYFSTSAARCALPRALSAR